MGDRNVSPESTEGSKSGFQYVDLKRNAVRGPDSHRGDLAPMDLQNETRRASWARSPTRNHRTSLEHGLPRPVGVKTDGSADAFKELLPAELTQRVPPDTAELRFSFPQKGTRTTGYNAFAPPPVWSKSSSLGRTPVGIREPELNPFGSVQEVAWKEQVDVWFREADTKQDGCIDGDEAVAFFTRTGLPTEELSKMWRYSVPHKEPVMSKTQFGNALKIVAVLQITSEVVSQAIGQPYPSPAPQIRSLEAPTLQNEDPPFTMEDDDSVSSSSSFAQQTRAYSLPVAPGGLSLDWGSHSGGDCASVRPTMRTHEISLDVAYSAELSDYGMLEDIPAKACLVSVQIRLAPLRSKEAAHLRKLIGVNGSLIAAPSLKGGLLQYFRIQDDPEGALDERVKKLESEDVDSAFCSEINPTHNASSGKVTSMLVHEQSGYLFLGFNDSFVEMHHVGKDPLPLTKSVNQWKAHKHGSIDAIAMTMWGDLWTGSSRGSVRIWSELSAGKTPTGVALKRPGGDKPHGGVKSIVVSSCGSVVWTAGQNNISIWEAYSGSFLGRIETDRGSLDNFGAPLQERNQRINPIKGLEVDSSGRIAGAQRFGIRTPTELEDSDMDAGTAGLKVAVGKMARIIGKGRKRIGKQLNNKNGFVMSSTPEEETTMSPIQALAAMLDRTIWVGYKQGTLERYAWNGQIKNRHAFTCGLSCLCVVDDRLWVGLNDGCIVVFDMDFRELKQWSAHEATVVELTTLGPLVYSLAADGSIKGWSRGIPHAVLDPLSWQKFMSCMKDVTVPHKFKILCGTWNVNQTRPPDTSLSKWLCSHGKLEQCDIVVLGLQEVEGTSSVAKTMAIGKYSKSNSDKGSATANWWANEFEVALREKNAFLERRWKRVALRQMSGIIIYVFARQALMKYIGNIGTAHVGTGVMGVGSNKGGVAITFSLYRRRVTVVAAHFAAHKENVAKRNNDYRSINQGLSFAKEKDVIPTSNTQGLRSTTVTPKYSFGDDDRYDSFKCLENELEETEVSSGLQQAELLVWLGDFNYRLQTTYDHALAHIRDNRAASLLHLDQCRDQMKEKRVFVGLREGRIQFNPTYKFDKGPGGGYDSSEKKRVPAWTDRIFFRGSKPFVELEEEEEIPRLCDEEAPLISMDSQPMSFVDRATAASSAHDADDIIVSCEQYDACMEVSDSDHKPVWCLLNVNFPAFIQEEMRNVSFNILRKDMSETSPKVALQLQSKFLEFIGDGQQFVDIQSRSEVAVRVTTFTEEADNANRHVPGWLDVMPRTFLLTPGVTERVTITVSQKGIGKRLHSPRLYRRLMFRAEAVQSGWRQIARDYDVGVLLRAT